MSIRLKIICLFLLITGINQQALASNELLNEQLVRIINQLNAIKPIISEAERYQSKNAPI